MSGAGGSTSTLAIGWSSGAVARNSSLSQTSLRLPGLPRPLANRWMPCGWPVNRFESTRQAWAGFFVAAATPLPSDETWVACLPVGPMGLGTTTISNGLGDFSIRAGQPPLAADELVIVVIATFWPTNRSGRIVSRSADHGYAEPDAYRSAITWSPLIDSGVFSRHFFPSGSKTSPPNARRMPTMYSFAVTLAKP